MKPAEFNPSNLIHAVPKKTLERADVVWSRMKLEPGEVLLVKLSSHMRPAVSDVKHIIDNIFKEEGDRVLIYFEDDMEFTKFTR